MGEFEEREGRGGEGSLLSLGLVERGSGGGGGGWNGNFNLGEWVVEKVGLGMVWVVMFLVKNGVVEWWCGVEIGRDATAFFSDLNFRFLLMHYITITLTNFFFLFYYCFFHLSIISN